MKIKFNNQIYNEKAIKTAVSAYNKIAKIKVQKTRSYYLVNIKNAKSCFKQVLKDEFSNYVLGLTKKCLFLT